MSESKIGENPAQVTIPPSAPRGGSARLAKLGVWGLRRLGWEVKGEFLNVPKVIAVVAPHSSNWDWVIGVFALWALRLKFSYLIKDAAFIWPISVILRRTGGIPIDRSNPIGIVEQVVDEFNKADKLYYAITPEGTRKAVSRWKNGFLRIAYRADVPVVPVSFDYSRKEIMVSSPAVLTGDIDQDLESIQSYFSQFKGRN